MRTILVDDQLLSLAQFEEECREISDIQLVGKFDNGEDALQFARNNLVEFALLDVEMPGMNGIELGAELKKLNPNMILIYVTGHSRYVVDTMRMKADYCIMKPYDKRDIMDAIMRVKLLSKRMENRVKINTFGRFEVYVDEKPVYFGNNKARELFALCVDKNGASVSMEEAIDVLWPERPYDDKVKRLYRKAVNAIQNVLEELWVSDVFESHRGSCHILREKVDCDLYRFMAGQGTDNSLRQELQQKGYLYDYSWAEIRQLELMRIYDIPCDLKAADAEE